MIDGTAHFVKFIWDNKEIIFSDKSPKERMLNNYKDLAWENLSYGTAKHPKVISDIGAHHGEFGLGCTSIYSNSEIYCYEPIISNVKYIKKFKEDFIGEDSPSRLFIKNVLNEFPDFLNVNRYYFLDALNKHGILDINFFQHVLTSFYNALRTAKTDNVWGNNLTEINLNVAPINVKDLHIFNFGLWSKDMETSIGISDKFSSDEEVSGLFSILHQDGLQAENIKMKDIKSLPERPELVKIDIEGSEWEILNNCGSYFDETKVMLIEIVKENHPNFNNHDKIPSLLKSRGFIEIDTPDGSDNKIYGRV